LTYLGPENSGTHPIPAQAFLTVLRMQAPHLWKWSEIESYLGRWYIRDDAYCAWIGRQSAAVEAPIAVPEGPAVEPVASQKKTRNRRASKQELARRDMMELWDKIPDRSEVPDFKLIEDVSAHRDEKRRPTLSDVTILRAAGRHK
jgi:hypothetical protein